MTTINTDESQNIEFKESWNDKYLQWICGFANAQGGRMFIGVNDKHEVIGVDNPKKLMEDIPNKVRNVLGIIVDVNLLDADGLDYIEVVVEAYPYPISYRGHYYQRSGATNQELKGAALDRLCLGGKARLGMGCQCLISLWMIWTMQHLICSVDMQS